MTTFDNSAPRDGWQVDPKTCPFVDCPICTARTTTNDEHLIRGTE